MDGALAIHNVEPWFGDEAVANGWAYPVDVQAKEAPVVAIIGAGPGGLSAAYHCLRHGMRAALFEAGGLPRSAIPRTRLPREVLDNEMTRLLALPGITLNTGVRLARDVSVDELLSSHEPVILSPGCQVYKSRDVGSAVPADLHEGLNLLKEFMDHGQFPAANRVVVHGGGNTAIDLCRLMKRS